MVERNIQGSTRSRIVESAKALFAEQGYQKTTIVDISKKAGLSEAALYEYFQGKEDLLLTIPDLWVADLIQDWREQRFGIKGAANQLRKFLWWYLRRIEKAPLDAKIVYLHLKTNANFMQTAVYANVKILYAFLLDIFEKGQQNGEIRPDVSPYAARDMFIGTMEHLATRWLLKDRAYPLFANLEETFALMLDGFRKTAAGTSSASDRRSAKRPGSFCKPEPTEGAP